MSRNAKINLAICHHTRCKWHFSRNVRIFVIKKIFCRNKKNLNFQGVTKTWTLKATLKKKIYGLIPLFCFQIILQTVIVTRALWNWYINTHRPLRQTREPRNNSTYLQSVFKTTSIVNLVGPRGCSHHPGKPRQELKAETWRQELKAGTWRQELKHKPLEYTANWLVLHGLLFIAWSSCLFI